MSVLRDWYSGNYRQITNTQLGHMDKSRFEIVVSEFAAQFESSWLVNSANVLFPSRDGKIFTGTYRDNNIMYNGMIKASNSAIGRLAKECEALDIVRRVIC